MISIKGPQYITEELKENLSNHFISISPDNFSNYLATL